MLNLDRAKNDKDLSPNFRGQLLLASEYRGLQCSCNDFAGAALESSSQYLMIVTEKEGSSVWKWRRSHDFPYYCALVSNMLACTLYLEHFSILRLSVLIGHRYLQQGVTMQNVSHILVYQVSFIATHV